ncbi:MAG: hypothetical protein EB120_02270 [Proteobacteria bacterium]|nr:hypothetical protein [Pseudomonadota bacterium]
MKYAMLLSLLLLTSCALLDLQKSNSSSEDRELASIEENPGDPITRRQEANLKEKIRFQPGDSASQALRKRILFFPFQNMSGMGGEETGKYAAEELKDKLSQLDEFIVVPEAELQGYETLIPAVGTPNYPLIFEKTRALGIVAFVVGSVKTVKVQERGNQVGLFQTRYNTVQTSLNFKLYDVATQKVMLDKDSEAEVTEEHTKFFGHRAPASMESNRSEGAISEAIEKAMPNFISESRRIGWTGRIAKIDIHRYYINAGEMSGITKNQLLRVFGDALPVVDQESGLVIGMAPGRFKGILKVVDFFGDDGAIAVVHSGAGFLEKDRVEAYIPPQP